MCNEREERPLNNDHIKAMVGLPAGFMVQTTIPPSLVELARTNPVVHAYLSQYERGDCTWEAALVGCVRTLAEQNRRLLEVAVKHAATVAHEVVLDPANPRPGAIASIRHW
jgi:hypothetical protein